jgi:hypothetical protein
LQKESQVAVPRAFRLATLLVQQLLPRILADGFQQAIARRGTVLLDDQEGFVDELGE